MTATHIRFREMQFFRLGKIWLLPACGAFAFFSWNVLADVDFADAHTAIRLCVKHLTANESISSFYRWQDATQCPAVFYDACL